MDGACCAAAADALHASVLVGSLLASGTTR